MTIKEKLEILVTEDSEKHLADARSVGKGYTNINFTFARTLQEAESLVRQNRYDAVVTDVFFPVQEGGEPASDSGLSLAKIVHERGIPFVYNTSGNHHGRAYKQFLEPARAISREIMKIWDNNEFGTGKMIEAYPEDSNAEKDTKQWGAAINYAILLGRSQGLSNEVRKAVGKLVKFSSYGDYGRLSGVFELILDESVSQEELERELRIYGGLNQDDALPFIRDTLAEYRRQKCIQK